MRTSQVLIPTLREDPGEAETVSHKLMLRAGLIRKVAAGIYTYLPLGLRVIRKIEQIIREEMNQAGAQELLMPIASPAELWQETGRWSFYGKELLRFKDRHEREFCLGPTHEEVITDLFRRTQAMIRVRLDDVLVGSDQACPCGSPLQVIEQVEGRKYALASDSCGDASSS